MNVLFQTNREYSDIHNNDYSVFPTDIFRDTSMFNANPGNKTGWQASVTE